MIKGVNKQFIEVSDTGSRYFEKALLVVRPEFALLPYDGLKAEARRALGRMGEPEAARRQGKNERERAAAAKRRRQRRIILSAVMCAVGMAVGTLLSRLLM